MIFGLIILFFVSFASYAVLRGYGQSIRDAIVSSWLLLAGFVFVSTELLSLLHWFTLTAITYSWCMLLVILSAGLFPMKKVFVSTLRRDFGWLKSNIKGAYCDNRFAFSTVALVLFLTFLHALLAPTSEPDSLSYHLPRATHWFANGSIGFYETAVARQNFQAPLYSFIAAHVMALTRSDLFFNMIQWIAWCVNALVVSLVAKECGVSKKHQLSAGMLALLLPQAISQVIVAINDLYATAAVMAFVLYLVRILNVRKVERQTVVLCALALGVALTAKYTSLVHAAGFAVPMCIWGLFRILRKESLKKALQVGVVLVIVVIGGFSLLLPQVTRNLRTYKDPFSGEPKNMLTNVNMTPKKLVVNFAKNASVHVATPLYFLNRQVERVVRNFAGDLIEDPDICYQNRWYFTDYRIFTPLGKSHLTASNPLHFIFFCFMVFVLVLHRFKNCGMILWGSVIPVAFGALLYAFVFKWQPACARLQMPYFMLMCVGLAQWLDLCKSKPVVEKGTFVVFSGYAVIHVFLWQTWFTPAFLYGKLPVEIYGKDHATLEQKIRFLTEHRWDKEIIDSMRKDIPPELSNGYSVFFTNRNRQYFGNSYHESPYDYMSVKKVVGYIETVVATRDYSLSIALLVSSDHGNIPCDSDNLDTHAFAYEFLFWKMIDSIDAHKQLRFQHLGVIPPVESAYNCFADKSGLILSDRTRESVLEALKDHYQINSLYTNRLFTVYQAVPVSDDRL